MNSSVQIPISPMVEKMDISGKDENILRGLGEEIAGIASLPVQKDKAKLWEKMNNLESIRPMVLINQIPWHEMNVDDELILKCESRWARELEDRLRKTIYQWKHMPGDVDRNLLFIILEILCRSKSNLGYK